MHQGCDCAKVRVQGVKAVQKEPVLLFLVFPFERCGVGCGNGIYSMHAHCIRSQVQFTTSMKLRVCALTDKSACVRLD